MGIDTAAVASQEQLTFGASRADTAPSARADGSDARVAELAREFEAMVMLQLLRQMRQSMLAEGDDEGEAGLGADTMRDTVDLELARQLSRMGGFGLAKVLQEAIERQYGDDAADETAGTGANALPLLRPEGSAGPSAGGRLTAVDSEPQGGTEPEVPLPLESKLTSRFGWRQDPLGGGMRFHLGVDIKAAYGREVPAASGGRVAFAGEQDGYGLTVVLEHGGGLSTRYAHLSSLSVGKGDEVEAGTVVGRVGQTGRSTGPHLHFEVREDGRAINPERAAARYAAALKASPEPADSSDRQGLGPLTLPGVPHEN